jgi:hypothetical protein
MIKRPECVSEMCTAPGTRRREVNWAAVCARSRAAANSGGASGGSSRGWIIFGRTSTHLSLADDRHGP